MTIIESLKWHNAQKKALLATNFYNVETLKAVLLAAHHLNVDIILQTSPSTIDYLSLGTTIKLAREGARYFQVNAYLHLDHATDISLIQACIDQGYDSVMIDASDKPFKENVEISRKVGEAAHKKGVFVEAELGCVPKLGEQEAKESQLTLPEEASDFVNYTGVDLLAVAIGTAHGFYKKEPNLDLNRLKQIRRATDVPLVLHGGSGIEPELWRCAIEDGISKINFATEIKDTFMRKLKCVLLQSDEIDLRKVFPQAIEEVQSLVEKKLSICHNL